MELQRNETFLLLDNIKECPQKAMELQLNEWFGWLFFVRVQYQNVLRIRSIIVLFVPKTWTPIKWSKFYLYLYMCNKKNALRKRWNSKKRFCFCWYRKTHTHTHTTQGVKLNAPRCFLRRNGKKKRASPVQCLPRNIRKKERYATFFFYVADGRGGYTRTK